MNFGFDESDIEPSFVEPLAEKSGRKKSDKSKVKDSSFYFLEKRIWVAEATMEKRPKKIREKGPIRPKKAPRMVN
jgi:hypothetical protein